MIEGISYFTTLKYFTFLNIFGPKFGPKTLAYRHFTLLFGKSQPKTQIENKIKKITSSDNKAKKK
jgi:hypothetical protein